MMKAIVTKLRVFVRDEEGLTTVEYSVAGALISLGLVAAFTALGAQVGVTLATLTAAITP